MHAQRVHESLVSGVDPMPADGAPQLQPAPLHLAPVGAKAVALDFDGGRLSADAGMVRLTDLDEQRGLPRALAAVLSDPRDAGRLHCTPEDLLKQRVFHLAAGDEEANDSHRLRADPLCTLLLARLPESGAPLASHPTGSRCENRVSRTELSRMALVWLEPCIMSYDSPPQRIGLEVDDPADRGHGQQEYARDDG
jgi:hypothetical protein